MMGHRNHYPCQCGKSPHTLVQAQCYGSTVTSCLWLSPTLPVCPSLLNSFTETNLISPVVPVFLFEPIKLGGIHLSPPQISVVLGASGFFQALWLLIAFPRLQHRFGTVGVLRACSIVWPFFFIACPLCNMFLRHHLTVPFWIVGLVALVVGSGVAMAFSKYSCLYPSTSRS